MNEQEDEVTVISDSILTVLTRRLSTTQATSLFPNTVKTRQ